MRLLALTLSRDGSLAAASALGGNLGLLETETLRWRTLLIDRLTQGIAWSLAFSPDTEHVASAHNDSVRLWSVAGKTPPREFRVPNERVNSVAFSPDGEILAAGTKANTIKLWHVDPAKERTTFRGKRGPVAAAGAVWALAFSPDGKTLAAASNDHSVRLWDIHSAREKAALAHDETIRSVAFSPDGKLLATGDDAGNVALWDVERGSRTARFTAPSGPHSVRALAFSAESTILAASWSNEVRLWELAKIRREE
jgi:WD40 repeat protein